MVKLWIHKPGGVDPYLVAEMSFANCSRQFDLQDSEYVQSLAHRPLTPNSPGPIGENPDPELVVFEVLEDEETGALKPGYYVSHMTADTVHELLSEE